MAISGISDSGVHVTTNADGSHSYSTGFDINSFYKLLAAQISNPSMDSNADNTDSFVNQMLQLATMESMNSMTNTVNTLAQLQNSSFAAGLVGQEVTVVEVDEKGMPITIKDADGNEELKTTTGIVTGVSLYGSPMVYVDGKGYTLSQLMDVGKTEVKDTDAGGAEDSDGSAGTGGVDGTDGANQPDGSTGSTDGANQPDGSAGSTDGSSDASTAGGE